MMSLKDKISSPLEAGLSILDAHHLPPHLTPALEYTSSRLAKKSIHLSLVIVRRDYQLPNIIPPHLSPDLCGSNPASPALYGGCGSSGSRSGFATSPVASFKSFFRSAPWRASKRRPESLQRKPAPSPGLLSANPLDSPRFRWPHTPASPISPPPMTPSTTTSLTSFTTADTSGPPTPGPGSLHFLFPGDMSPTTERVMKTTISKAGMKFGLGSWLSPFSSTFAREVTDQLYQNSLVQHETLFSSDGLTLLALDRLYSVKSALSKYSKTGSPMLLEDSVDELRRYVLASNGNRISRSDLLRSYDWLSVSDAAAADLDRMYRRAYGGPDLYGGISGMPQERLPEPRVVLTSSFDDDSDEECDDDDDDDDNDDDNDEDYTNMNQYAKGNETRYEQDTNDYDYERWYYDHYIDVDDDEEVSPSSTIRGPDVIGLAITTPQLTKLPRPAPQRTGSHLTVHTGSELKPRVKALRGEMREDDDDDRTARPIDAQNHPWNSRFAHPRPVCTSTFTPHNHASSGNRSNRHNAGTNTVPRSRNGLSFPVNPLGAHPIILRTLASSEQYPPEARARTPRGGEDLSPATRSEWQLFIGNKGLRGRIAAVETC